MVHIYELSQSRPGEISRDRRPAARTATFRRLELIVPDGEPVPLDESLAATWTPGRASLALPDVAGVDVSEPRIDRDAARVREGRRRSLGKLVEVPCRVEG